MSGSTLRVGVATDGPIVAWQASCIEALAGVPGVVVDRWFQRSDAPSRWSSGSSEASTAVSNVPFLPATPGLPRVRQGAPGAVDGTSHLLDVLLDLTRAGSAPPLEVALEVWHFTYGEGDTRDPYRAALLDYIRHPGRSKVALVSQPSGRVLREGRLAWSRGEQLDRILLDPSDWPALVARDRLDPAAVPEPVGGSDKPAVQLRRTRAPDHANRLAAVPGPVLEIAAVGRRMLRMGGSLTRDDDWNVGVMSGPIEQLVAADVLPEISWLPRRPGHFAADPFGVERDSFLHVFFEDYDQRIGRGSIAHIGIEADGSATEVEPVLDPGVHASYPFMIEREGTVFMLPETSAAGELVLYEAVAFPRQWRRAATLLSVPAVDTTVIEHEGRWWMFATRRDRGPNHNLFIWHAPELTGPWQSHEANPVKTDARSARPGGTPFVVDGRLYRPSQDNSHGYGGSVVLNGVEVLTPTRFVERPVNQVRPATGSRYKDGLHTISSAGNRTLVDGNVRHLVREALTLAVGRRFGRRPQIPAPSA